MLLTRFTAPISRLARTHVPTPQLEGSKADDKVTTDKMRRTQLLAAAAGLALMLLAATAQAEGIRVLLGTAPCDPAKAPGLARVQLDYTWGNGAQYTIAAPKTGARLPCLLALQYQFVAGAKPVADDTKWTTVDPAALFGGRTIATGYGPKGKFTVFARAVGGAKNSKLYSKTAFRSTTLVLDA